LKPRLLLLLLSIVALPLAALTAVGLFVARDERALQEHQFRELARSSLMEVDVSIGRVLEDRRRELDRLADGAALEPTALRELIRGEPLARQAFVLDGEGRLLFPREGSAVTENERQFLERSAPVWRRGELARLISGRAEQPVRSSDSTWKIELQRAASNIGYRQTAGPSGEAGWMTWYWGSGTHFLYWRRSGGDRVLGFEVDRARLLADVIAALPATESSADEDDARGLLGRRVLRDANGEVLYQWGRGGDALGADPNAKPLASLGLSPPLQAWRLDEYVPEAMLAAGGGGLWFGIVAGLVGSGALLVLLAVYFYRESSREMREAAQRVNFVNQVSHELKTPLTNIRMYAELMEGRLGEEADPKTREWLDVISSESQRLSRLIGNVLTFGRGRRKTLKLHGKSCRADEIAGAVVERFRPALERRGLKVETALEPADLLALDADALDQILGNLLGNVEKYGGAEGTVRVGCRRDGETIVISVADEGPGVPAAEAERIFRPFYRVSNKLSDGVSGAGIGLAIARELARLHGGDVRLVESGRGAAFEARVKGLEKS
jgi:signal transduction histidine kinase